MTDSTTTAPLVNSSYDGRRSGSGGRTGRGVEVRVQEVRRRNWSTEERLRIVRETLEPGVIVQAVADRHGVSTGQLYTWRKEMLATAMAGFVPVEVVPEAAQLPPPGPAMSPDSCVSSGVIEIYDGLRRQHPHHRMRRCRDTARRAGCDGWALMLGPPPGTRVFLACGTTDMRKGFDGLAAQVQTVLAQDPYSGAMFCFRGRRGDLLKILVWDGQGLIKP